MIKFVDASEVTTSPPLIIGLTGLSDSGKTFSSLLMAQNIARNNGGPVFTVDTEAGRMSSYKNAELYPELNPYKIFVMEPPYDGNRFVEIIEQAEEEKAGCLVIDSFSDEWEGEGGCLWSHDDYIEQKSGGDIEKAGKYEMVAWKHAKKPHNKLHNKLLSTRLPIILCFRAREKIKVRGSSIIPMGVQPICDSRMIYDFKFFLHMDETKKDGSYKQLKSGYRHERKVFKSSANDKIDEVTCKRLIDLIQGNGTSASQDSKTIPVESTEPKSEKPKRPEVWIIDDNDELFTLQYKGPLGEHESSESKKDFYQMLRGLLEMADQLAIAYPSQNLSPKQVSERLYLTNQMMVNSLPKQAAQIILDMVYGDNIPKELKR